MKRVKKGGLFVCPTVKRVIWEKRDLYAPHTSLIMTHGEAYRCNTQYGTHTGRHIQGMGGIYHLQPPSGRHIYQGGIPLITPQGSIYTEWYTFITPQGGIYRVVYTSQDPSGRHITVGYTSQNSSGRLYPGVYTSQTSSGRLYPGLYLSGLLYPCVRVNVSNVLSSTRV